MEVLHKGMQATSPGLIHCRNAQGDVADGGALGVRLALRGRARGVAVDVQGAQRPLAGAPRQALPAGAPRLLLVHKLDFGTSPLAHEWLTEGPQCLSHKGEVDNENEVESVRKHRAKGVRKLPDSMPVHVEPDFQTSHVCDQDYLTLRMANPDCGLKRQEELRQHFAQWGNLAASVYVDDGPPLQVHPNDSRITCQRATHCLE
mmetsp:Transcript_20471/g.27607  ORF Transcript_20471/g.27607 Transcript_20471/m.27607 type:complete len:203 (-) Transcript_20471:43-651(-)